jgi:hypothetical protein
MAHFVGITTVEDVSQRLINDVHEVLEMIVQSHIFLDVDRQITPIPIWDLMPSPSRGALIIRRRLFQVSSMVSAHASRSRLLFSLPSFQHRRRSIWVQFDSRLLRSQSVLLDLYSQISQPPER